MASHTYTASSKSPPLTLVTSRRIAVATALFAMSGGAATTTAEPLVDERFHPDADAQLVAIGREAEPLAEQWHRLLNVWWSLEVPHPNMERCADAMQVPLDRLRDVADAALPLQATTPEGMRAKAILLQHFFRVVYEEDDGEMHMPGQDEKLVWSLLCDLTGRAA